MTAKGEKQFTLVSSARSSITRRSYAEHANDFDAACQWLVELGVNVDRTRIGRCARLLREIDRHYGCGTIGELIAKYDYPELYNAMFESSELINIHHGLAKMESTYLSQNLRTFTKGCILLSDESRTGNNVARNTGFELDVAASFRNAQCDIRLKPPADLWVLQGKHQIAIECKRPFSYDGLASNVEEAYKQLRQRYRDSGDARVRGIAAIAVSKMENAGPMMLVAKTEAKLGAILLEFWETFQTHFRGINWNPDDSRTLAVLACLRAPSYIEDMNLFTVVREFAWISVAESVSDRSLVRSLGDRFNRLAEN